MMDEELTVFSYAKDSFKFNYDKNIKDAGKPFFERLEREYGAEEVLTAIDIVVEQYGDAVTAVHMIERILRNRKAIIDTLFGDD